MSPVSVEQIHDASLPVYDRMESLIRWKQKQITDAIEKIDSNPFRIDDWKREDGHGGGVTMVLQDANVFEKGGVNISVIDSKLTPQGVSRMRVNHKNLEAAEDGTVNFRVCGLSLVIHPRNPHAPTVHANYRYFETLHPQTGETQSWWFGGGADLTPSYLYEEDAKLFHASHQSALDKYDKELYPKWKKWCDEYFFIKHRGESRGIGGIFFDDFDAKSPDAILKIVESCFDAFIDSYVEIVNRRKDTPFTEEQKQWQQLRRGRYVEFNLVIDRGTQFGLQTPGARIESILMTLPLTASWLYDHQPEEGSEEHRLLTVLKNPIEWV